MLNRTNNSYPFFTHTHHCQHLAAPASYSLHTHFLPQPFESNLQASYPFNPKHISAFLKNRHILLHNYSTPIKFRKFKYYHNLIQSIFVFQSSFKFHVICFHSVQSLSRVQLIVNPWIAARQGASPTPRACSNSHPSSRWCHPTISSSVVPFSSHLQTFPPSGYFPMSRFFSSGGQRTGASPSASVLPMNILDWFPLRWTGWISLQSKGLSRAFSNTTVQKHQFFGAQLSLQSNSHIHTWLLEKP